MRSTQVQTGIRNKPRNAEKLRRRQRVLHPTQHRPFKPATTGTAGRLGCLGRSAPYLSVENQFTTRQSENEKRKGKAVLSPVSLSIDRPVVESYRHGLNTRDGLAQDPISSTRHIHTLLRRLHSRARLKPAVTCNS